MHMAEAKNAIVVSLSQVAARELYELAMSPRIVATTLSAATKAEILEQMRPVIEEK
jgi:hypothetical protein